MKTLLVEDERHKREELTSYLEAFYGDQLQLEHVDSVRQAFLAVAAMRFGLIILDIALPTFSTEEGTKDRGYDQAFGGVEVLRALKSKGIVANVIVITQYPDITIGDKKVKLSAAASVLSRRYTQNVIGGVLYKYGSPGNQPKLIQLLSKVK